MLRRSSADDLGRKNCIAPTSLHQPAGQSRYGLAGNNRKNVLTAPEPKNGWRAPTGGVGSCMTHADGAGVKTLQVSTVTLVGFSPTTGPGFVPHVPR
jgi:hypothetical protein